MTPERMQEKFDEIERRLSYEKRTSDLEHKLIEIEKTKPAEPLVILGQTLRIPINKWMFGIVTTLLVGLALVLFAIAEDKENRISGIVAVVLDKARTGEYKSDPKQEVSRIFNLSTPTIATLDYLKKIGVVLTEEQLRYYSVDSNAIEQFEAELRLAGAQGWTRWEGVGAGTLPPKPQWIWSITMGKDSVTTKEQIAAIYEKVFKRNKGVYIEEVKVSAQRK